MEKLNYSIKQAMDLLNIPSEQRTAYKGMIGGDLCEPVRTAAKPAYHCQLKFSFFFSFTQSIRYRLISV